MRQLAMAHWAEEAVRGSQRGRLPLPVDGGENPRRRDVIWGRSGSGNNEEDVNRQTDREKMQGERLER
ncbi:hypothetical protein EJB05_47270 [Eragrostis curvula]|uniref:Uncharacterized protein n=1 Tax=Eragrostis curvula TaxID=38414 RepID=A0A5J9T793_9POAL|nr:hypothetical protein EJB05_47270 [Eragrostis curvula]